MANQIYMTIAGKAQGLISAACSTQNSMGNGFQSDHTDEIMVLSYTHNMTIVDISKATHNPIILSKYIDKSSPLLAQALSHREEVNGKLHFYRVAAAGSQEKYYTIEFRGGLIVDLTADFAHASSQLDSEPQEHLAIRYRDIFWTHHVSATSSYSSWRD